MQKQVSAIISLKDRFSGPLLKMSKNIEKLDKETKSSMNRVNRWGKQVERSVDRAVKATVKWAKRGAVLATGWSLKSGFEGTKELDYAARKVKSIAKDRLELPDIMQDIKDFSFEFGKAYEEIGDGMYNAISASIPIELLNEAVELGNQLSIAGFTDMDSSISLMAATMNAFDMKTSEEMQNMADQFLTTQNLGVITVDEMAQYYGRISTLSGQIGATLEEQNAAMATMTMRGMTQREATTSYRSILNAFLKDTTDAQATALDAMGLGAEFLSAKTFKELGFSGVVEEVARAAEGDLDLVSQIFKDIRGKTGAIMFGPTAGMDDYERILKELQNPEGVLDDAHAVLNQSVERQWDIFKNRIRTLNDELYTEEDGMGGYLVEQLKQANDWLDENREGLIQSIQDISESIIETVKTVGGFLSEHGDKIKTFLKIIAGMYIFTKVTGWISSFASALGSIGGVAKGLFSGSIKFGGVLMPLLGGMGSLLKIMLVPALKLIAGLGLLGGSIWVIKELATGAGSLKDRWQDLKDTIKGKIKPEIDSSSLDSYRKEIKTTEEKSEEFNRFLNEPKIGTAEFINDKFNKDIEDSEDLVLGLNKSINQFSPFTAESILEGHTTFRNRTNQIIEDWRTMRAELASPIVARATIHRGVTGSFESVQGPIDRSLNYILGENYKGTPSWKGGPTKIHERGGEIMDLPGGTRIYPHDESVKMARQEGATQMAMTGAGGQVINVDLGGVNFSGDFNTEADINEIGTKIVDKIKKELKNI